MLQWPATVGQLALEVQLVPVWILQKPVCGQLLLAVQLVPVWMLQWPLASVQSAFVAQLEWVMLHVPTGAHALLDMQLAPLLLQVPGSDGQLALEVQLALVWMLQVPGLGVQTGGAQVVFPVHGFSGSGGRRLQPAGV
jgi:hypothetical protein